MRAMAKPNDSVDDVFKNCISKVKNAALKSRLNACRPEIIRAANDLENKLRSASAHSITGINPFSSGVTAKEMQKVYTLRMAKKNGPGRYFYDKVIASAPKGKCPLCGHRDATTIDHYVDKAVCSQFSVTPVNLVPACRDCNTNKSHYPFPTSPALETLHPYFDNIEKQLWLYADVVQSAGVPIVFSVQAPTTWSRLAIDRTRQHFKVFGLSRLYSLNAADELGNIRQRLTDLFKSTGAPGLAAHLLEEAASRKAMHLNSWQTAMYSALGNSAWFCTGGVFQI